MADEHPPPGFHFQVEWARTKIGFAEVSGLNVEAKVIEYRHGASSEVHETRMPGVQEFGNITMKRGTCAIDGFYAWRDAVALNRTERHDLTVSLVDENHEPVVVWKVKNAWPTKLPATDLDSSDNEVAIESIEIAHEGLTIHDG